jgi:eukaryotic-like serine/threonine-protein kinase
LPPGWSGANCSCRDWCILAKTKLRLTKGFLLGPYEILAPLGAGGMGEVYRARDVRLGRTVAIKLLPVGRSQDAQLRLRFNREAKAIASLNHPHICALYDIGEMPRGTIERETSQYLVLEYLEGETLDARLKKGALPFPQVLRHATEIADALDKAHQRHILHRDLKPSNIMITPSGAKLLDFGLAKFFRSRLPPANALTSSSESFRQQSSDATTEERPLTAEGSVVGTVDYMAPEQLEGKEPDTRADVFSFGVCLYQMATGKRPFRGDSRSSLLAAIRDKTPPPVSTYQPSSPPSFDWLVRTCLEKEPAQRIQTAHDVMLELKRIAEMDLAGPGTDRARRPNRWSFWPMVIVFLALTMVAGLALWKSKRVRYGERRARRFSILLPVTAPLASISLECLAVSPDGGRLIYSAGADPTQLYLYSLEKLQATPIAGTVGGRGPFFSAQGDWIGFYTINGELKKLSLAGGEPITLSQGRDLRGATWASDDTIVFAEPRSPLQKISASGGQSEALPTPNEQANVRWPTFLPGGENVLYTVSDFSGNYENAKLAVLSVKTGTSKVVINGATYGRYIPTGHIVYFHSGTLFAVPFDARSLEVKGPPVPIVYDVESHPSTGLAHFAVSLDGSLFYVPQKRLHVERTLVSIDRTGKAIQLSNLRRAYDEPRLSPDGNRLVVTIRSDHDADLWMYDIGRDSWIRLTNGARNTTGIWSPDGKQIVFSSNRHWGFNLFLIPSDGGIAPRQITARKSWPFPTSWSPDGRTIAIVEQYRDRRADIFLLPVNPLSEPKPFLTQPYDENYAVFSPDGHWIAYQSNESGQFEVYVQKYPQDGPKWLVSLGGGTLPLWRHDGRELFYRNGNKMMALEVNLGARFHSDKPRILFRGDFEPAYDVFPDGKRFIMIRRTEPSPNTQINVVLDLFENLDTSAKVQRDVK